jgi:hypothetical protein
LTDENSVHDEINCKLKTGNLHKSRMEEGRRAFKILKGKPARRKLLGGPGLRRITI